MEPITSMSLENLTSLFLNETEMDKAEGNFNMEEKAQGYWMYKVSKDDCFCYLFEHDLKDLGLFRRMRLTLYFSEKEKFLNKRTQTFSGKKQ